MKIIFATNNKHKLEEIRKMAGSGFQLISLEEIGLTGEIPEDHDTLEENALEKAKYIYDQTRIPTFADDTGLEVTVLNGQPGVLSARYAGPGKNDRENMQKLLRKMENETNRSARFRTVIAFIQPGGKEVLFEGIINGQIGTAPRGNLGFGYDPVFIPDGYHTTFAEMTPDLKNSISHRYLAFSKFIAYLKNTYI